MPDLDSTTRQPEAATVVEIQQSIEALARAGAERILQRALEAEVEEHLRRFADLRHENGHQAVVRNGHAPQRMVYTGVGPVTIRRPRVDERSGRDHESHEEFSTPILPQILRRTPTLEGALAVLYLKGISTNLQQSPCERNAGRTGRSGHRVLPVRRPHLLLAMTDSRTRST